MSASIRFIKVFRIGVVLPPPEESINAFNTGSFLALLVSPSFIEQLTAAIGTEVNFRPATNTDDISVEISVTSATVDPAIITKPPPFVTKISTFAFDSVATFTSAVSEVISDTIQFGVDISGIIVEVKLSRLIF